MPIGSHAHQPTAPQPTRATTTPGHVFAIRSRWSANSRTNHPPTEDGGISHPRNLLYGNASAMSSGTSPPMVSAMYCFPSYR